MKLKIIIILFLLFTLAACSPENNQPGSYQPEASDIGLETWAEKYPVEYADWEASVHGQAYLAGDSNAPACTDCHRHPDSGEMHTAAFRLDIPNRCARCHDDPARMTQYGVSTDVYDTYLADYHGATIAYYRAMAPDTRRSEAVCSDCHGSHAIYPPEDERSTVTAANLEFTCQKCHHAATSNFAAAYGHYRPIRSPVSSADSPFVFVVKLLYQAMIPVTLGSMIGYIALDIRHRVKKGAGAPAHPEQTTSQQLNPLDGGESNHDQQ